MNFKKTLFLLVTILGFYFAKAQELPKEKLTQFSITTQQSYKNDTLTLRVENSLFCPLRLRFFSTYLKEEKLIDDTIKVNIAKKSYIEFKCYAKDIDEDKINFKFDIALGDESKKIIKNKLSLPFPKGEKYRIMQEQQGSHSHNDNYSRYAIDFAMPVGEMIVAADEGYVVGVIKDYQYGGSDIKWKPYANFITVYHPQSGLFTQYAHLKRNGSFVNVGDMVKRNQPIGLSGETGYVSGAHLHFNVLVPEKNKTLISVPFSFENNLDAKNLKRNMKVKK